MGKLAKALLLLLVIALGLVPFLLALSGVNLGIGDYEGYEEEYWEGYYGYDYD